MGRVTLLFLAGVGLFTLATLAWAALATRAVRQLRERCPAVYRSVGSPSSTFWLHRGNVGSGFDRLTRTARLRRAGVDDAHARRLLRAVGVLRWLQFVGAAAISMGLFRILMEV
jgi:hypothetical protein